MFNYPGNIHIHSCYSDGSGNFDQITIDAKSAGLSFVIISDHETLTGLPEEGVQNGVNVLVGVEINRSQNHYLALDLDQLIKSDEQNPQQVIDRVKKEGGLGFIAHPFEKGSRYIEKGKAYPWKYWPVFNFDGLELWNYTSHWRGRHPSLFKTLYYFFFNRKAAMDSPPREALQLWDCYNNNGHRITAIGSSDAHASLYKLGLFKVTVFTYRYIFKTINTYIVLKEELSENYHTARKQIIGALRCGCCFISFDSLYAGNNFYYYAKAGSNTVLMGEQVNFQEKLALFIKAPKTRSMLRLLRNGKIISEKEGKELKFYPEQAGVYRAEVYFCPRLGRPRPWIYSNPIYILPA